MFCFRFSLLTPSLQSCTSSWPSRPSRHGAWPTWWRVFWRSQYLFLVGWVYGQVVAFSGRCLQEMVCIPEDTSRSQRSYRAHSKIFYAWTVMRSLLQQCVLLHSALHAGVPIIHWIQRMRVSLFVIQLRCAVSCKLNMNCCLIPTGRLVIDARNSYMPSI